MIRQAQYCLFDRPKDLHRRFAISGEQALEDVINIFRRYGRGINPACQACASGRKDQFGRDPPARVQLGACLFQVARERLMAVDELEDARPIFSRSAGGRDSAARMARSNLVMSASRKTFSIGKRGTEGSLPVQMTRPQPDRIQPPFASVRRPACEAMKMRSSSLGGRGAIRAPSSSTMASIATKRRFLKS